MGAPKGNKNAAKERRWAGAIRRALAEYESPKVTRGEALVQIARNLVKSAVEESDWGAITEIGNRLDGKPAQSIDLSADMTVRNVDELSDSELAAIAAGSSTGAADAADGPQEPTELH